MPSYLQYPPYNSRNTQPTTEYNLIGFRPGRALQGSELNELQENIWHQQSITMRFLYDITSGDTFNYSASITKFFVSIQNISLSYYAAASAPYPLTISIPSSDLYISSFQGNSTINGAFRIWRQPINSFVIIPSTEETKIYVKTTELLIESSLNPNDPGYSLNDSITGNLGADRIKYELELTTTSGPGIVEVLKVAPTGNENEFIITDRLNRTKTITI